ncbi:hypothetical protein ACFX2A_019574 [Malus domestica]
MSGALVHRNQVLLFSRKLEKLKEKRKKLWFTVLASRLRGKQQKGKKGEEKRDYGRQRWGGEKGKRLRWRERARKEQDQ